MSFSIQTNISSQFAGRSLNYAQNGVQSSMQRLSSGLRINSAKDDAAGLGITSRMTSEIRGTNVITRGIRDGMSLTQVAQGGLRNIADALQRARELAVQAANGTLQASDRQALDAEYQQLMAQINQVARSTEAFGHYPLRDTSTTAGGGLPPIPSTTPHITEKFPSSGVKDRFDSSIVPLAYIPAGAKDVQIDIDSFSWDDDIQLFTRSGVHLVGTPLNDAVWSENGVTDSADVKSKVFLDSSGFLDSANYDSRELLSGHDGYTAPPTKGSVLEYNGMEIAYSGDGLSQGNSLEQVRIDKTTEPILVMVVGRGEFDASASWSYMPEKGEGGLGAEQPSPTPPEAPMDILVSAHVGRPPSYVRIEKTPSDTKTLGVAGTGLDPFEAIESAMNRLDAAIDKVSSYATRHGAVESRLETSLAYGEVEVIATSAARSRILDSDFAAETAALAMNQIRMSASLAMSAQANARPKLVMALLGES